MSQYRGYIDIAAVKAAATLEQVLTHYGVLEHLHGSGGALRGCCPIHKGDDPSQFSVTLEKKLWRCFSECQCGGNHLDFVMRMEQCHSNEAAWLMNDWFELGLGATAAERTLSKTVRKPRSTSSGGKVEDKAPKAAKTTRSPAATDPVSEEEGENEPNETFLIPNLDASHPYLAERGLSPETIAHFGIGYCAKGIMAGRIAIPIHNAQGQVVANAGRWPGEPPKGQEKYRLPGKFKKTLEFYNLHRAALEPDDVPLVIVEGFFSVMHLWQFGVSRVAALMGSSMSSRQEELLAQIVTPSSRIVAMLDNDDAGRAATLKIVPRLAEHAFVQSFRWPDCVWQPDALGAGHLAPLLR